MVRWGLKGVHSENMIHIDTYHAEHFIESKRGRVDMPTVETGRERN